MTEQYTDEELLDKLTALAEELGRSPTVQDLSGAEGYPSPNTYYRRFRSWNDAKRAANLEIYSAGGPQVSDEELIDDLKRVDRLLDGEVTVSTYEEEGSHSPHTYQSRFGSWNAARQKAGLEFRPPGGEQEYTDEELLEMIRELNERVEGELRQRDIHEADDLPTWRTFRTRLGKWKDIWELADLGGG